MGPAIWPIVAVLGVLTLCLLALGLLVDSILKRLEEDYSATEE